MITNIRIKNYKAIKNIDIPLSPLTIFTGLNGLGKSSVLQSLLLMRQSFKDNSFKSGLFLRNEELLQMGLGKDVFSVGADPNEDLSFDLEWDFEDNLKLGFRVEMDKDVLPLNVFDCSDILMLKTRSLFSNNFQYLSANRIVPQVQYKTSTYFVDELNSLGKMGEYTAHYLAKNHNKSILNIELQHPNSKSDSLLDNVDAWLSEVSPGVKVSAEYHRELEVATLSYRFEQKDDYTDAFKPTHVGFGLTYVLPVITALLMTDKGGLIIIENPESHLHPAGQSKIGHLCAIAAESGIQIIMETHSDHIVNGLRVAVKNKKISNDNASLYFFERDIKDINHETEVIPLYIDERGKIDEWPRGFMDEWEKQLDELLSE